MEARVEAWLCDKCHSAWTIGVRNEPMGDRVTSTKNELGAVVQVD